jgi:hypothetical protein
MSKNPTTERVDALAIRGWIQFHQPMSAVIERESFPGRALLRDSNMTAPSELSKAQSCAAPFPAPSLNRVCGNEPSDHVAKTKNSAVSTRRNYFRPLRPYWAGARTMVAPKPLIPLYGGRS